MRLTLDEREVETVAQLHTLPVWTSDGDKIPLASLAEFRFEPGPERIQRDNRRTGVWVGARYEEGTMEDYLPLVSAAMDGMDLPFGYTWTMSEWAERRREQSLEFLIDLLLALGLVFAVMAGFHATLTLPGIAGIILTVGMAVDANVLIFERIREELRSGKTVRAAIDAGYGRAFTTILDANVTTLITAVVL